MKLNKAQNDAVKYTDGPLLIVAGAGTGKTTVITQKIIYLIEQKKIAPENILALTFTDKAAAEMQDRVDVALNLGYVDLKIETFHSFCQQILEQYGLDIGIPNKFNISTETDAWLMLKEHIYDLNLSYYRPLGSPSFHIHELLRHFSKCKDELVCPSDYIAYAESLALNHDDIPKEEQNKILEVANAYHAYNQLLLDKGVLDFGDIIFYTVKLLEERPLIRKVLQERFTHILVDEFQDVNWAQYRLIQLLAGKSQLTVVGDDDQSIYAFRGASVSNILHFKEDYPKAKEIVLTENYRSGQKILDLAHESIVHNNPDRLEVKLKINKKLTAATKKQGLGSVIHIHVETVDQEVQSVIEEIQKLKTENIDTTWNDFAILVRANNHADPFIGALEHAGISYEYISSSGLFRKSIILDAFHFFCIIDDYRNSASVYRMLRLPFLHISERDILQFTHMAKKKSVSYYEMLKRAKEFGLTAEGIEVCDTLMHLIHDGIKHARYEKPTIVLMQFLKESGYIGWLMQQVDSGDQNAACSIQFLKQFFSYIEKYQDAVANAHVSGFVAYYTEVLESGDEGTLYQPSEISDSVNIMTVHGAKGLEFKYVFVVNCVEQRFPSTQKSASIELPIALIKESLPEGNYHYQEERRLFYVAITRAKERLYFTSANFYEGAKRKKKISRFLNEIQFTDTLDMKRINMMKDKYVSRTQKKEDKKTSSVLYEIPKRFSFSSLRAFQVCPYQFKMAYILKVPLQGSPQFSFGNSMHITLQKFYKQIQTLNSAEQGSLFTRTKKDSKQTSNIHVLPFDDLLELYETSWISDWYHSKHEREEYFKKGRQILKTFYTFHTDNWTIPLTLEKGFKLKLGKYLITGKIDRVDQLEDGSLHIIDYKTGKVKEKIIGDDKDQLLLYQLIAEQLPEYRNIGKVGNLTYYYLNKNVQIDFLGKEKDIKKLEEKMIKIIDKIYATDFSAITKKQACGRCNYCKLSTFRM